MFIPQDVIKKERDGEGLSTEDITHFVQGIADGSISDEQIAAFGMAVFFKGMSIEEISTLTLAMRDTGDVQQWDLPGPVLDKHSTGGVGDNVSLMLGPILAACGAYVPMVSGRGLGHTGGTLDKLEAIPGYQVMQDEDAFHKIVESCGIAIVGAGANIAPADKRFYAIRDLTATVESIPLITASILSKKLSAGLGSLVMDVKAGNGAFMPSYELSYALAKSITQVANTAGVKTTSIITDMNQVLTYNAGNAVEISDSVEYLTGVRREPRLEAITNALCVEVLQLGGLANNVQEAQAQIDAVLANGKAAEIYGKMIALQGGPVDFIENYTSYLPKASIVKEIYAPSAGIVSEINTREVGMSVIELGGGRSKPGQTLDYSVGFSDVVRLGTHVDANTPLAIIHANSEASCASATKRLLAAIRIGTVVPEVAEIYEILK